MKVRRTIGEVQGYIRKLKDYVKQSYCHVRTHSTFANYLRVKSRTTLGIHRGERRGKDLRQRVPRKKKITHKGISIRKKEKKGKKKQPTKQPKPQ